MMVGDGELEVIAPELASALRAGANVPAVHAAAEVVRETVRVAMPDGTRLASDLYFPPRLPAPTVAVQTPYGRALHADVFLTIARCGYVVVSQDCRGTGDSEPDHWDFGIYDDQDSVDFVEWVSRQEWCEGFIGSFGGSYVGGIQWGMTMHPAMSAIAPEVAGLGVLPSAGPRLYMFVNAYSRTAGKGENVVREEDAEDVLVALDEMERRMVDETLAGGYFNEPLFKPFRAQLLDRYPELRALSPGDGQRWLYDYYSGLAPEERRELVTLALGTASVTFTAQEELWAVFGHRAGWRTLSFPGSDLSELVRSVRAPALVITGWYDWGLGDTLASWRLVSQEAREPVRSRSRLLITPSAHNKPGYHEGREEHPELERTYRGAELLALLLEWYRAVREGTVDSWPAAIYYLMGANEWRAASAWPPPEAELRELHLGPDGALTEERPQDSTPDTYTYDPQNPTPTVGGSLVSSVYTPGSVDVSEVQERSDVLTYTTEVLDRGLDVVGPMLLILYASSSAVDTDFSARVSDVFPDGRAIQLQHVTLRARYRNAESDPELLEPGRIYRFEIDLWATANRFRAGHRLRLDISSADFPKFDRHTNRAGEDGPLLRAQGRIYHDPEHPSHLLLSVLDTSSGGGGRA